MFRNREIVSITENFFCSLSLHQNIKVLKEINQVILMSCVDKFLKVVSCCIGSAVHRKLPEVMQRSTKIVLNKHNRFAK
jgi:hypothetical protein